MALKFKINYTGESKVIKRLCERVNGMPILGKEHDDAYYGDQGEAAYQHSLQKGNPHDLTLKDLGIEKIKDQVQSIMEAIGTVMPWTRHTGESITDHDGEPIYFQGTARLLEWH